MRPVLKPGKIGSAPVPSIKALLVPIWQRMGAGLGTRLIRTIALVGMAKGVGDGEGEASGVAVGC
jgi:predicted histidine transporter YuiF (NhaC family)